MGDEGKLYVPSELVSVYREKVSNPITYIGYLFVYLLHAACRKYKVVVWLSNA